MLTLSRAARLSFVVVALLLSIPTIGIRFQNDMTLSEFHGRLLNAWPDSAEFIDDPSAFLRKAKSWLADRAYPIVEASRIRKKFLFYALRTPPQKRITLGKDGFIFVNGVSDADVNGLLHSCCIAGHSDAATSGVRDALPGLAAFVKRRKMAVDVVIVPTLATLYGDFLPGSVPEALSLACLQRTKGDSPLYEVQKNSPIPFVYPFAEMSAMRDDEAFFPKGNWHASGLSLKVVRDTYLARLNVAGHVDETLERGTSASEIMETYGIDNRLPVYFIRNRNVVRDHARAGAIEAVIGSLFARPYGHLRVFGNSKPLRDDSVVMLADSYGDLAAEVFAGAFAHLTAVNTNELADGWRLELVDRLAHQQTIDRLILLFQEGNVGVVERWARALSSSAAN